MSWSNRPPRRLPPLLWRRPSILKHGRSTVFVHIDAADRGVELEGRLQLDGPWVTSFSCKAPCDTAHLGPPVPFGVNFSQE
jgi:hypothetical protein